MFRHWAFASPPPVIPTGAGRKARGVEESRRRRPKLVRQAQPGSLHSLRSVGMTDGVGQGRGFAVSGNVMIRHELPGRRGRCAVRGWPVGASGNIGNIVNITRNNVTYPPDVRSCPEPVEGACPEPVEGSGGACRAAPAALSLRPLSAGRRCYGHKRWGAGSPPVRAPARSPARPRRAPIV